MFEPKEEWSQRVKQTREEVLSKYKIPRESWGDIFANMGSSRLNKRGFERVKDSYTFQEIKFDKRTFSTQDLVKISRYNSRLYYIAAGSTTVHTNDKHFASFCVLIRNDITLL